MEILLGLAFYLLPIAGFVFIVLSLMAIRRSMESIDVHMSRISRSLERCLHGPPTEDSPLETTEN